MIITVMSTVTETETISGFATAMTTLSTFLTTSTFAPVATAALLPVNNAIQTGHVNWPVTLGLGLLLVVGRFT
ncbi:hypothetical protein Clacol_005537 [Clathrus columnatus]|uniref:Uncharacterized protein n=1 Tax=Clathrus columnatus TaxID=1419009 RepID=A0AAV5AH93_9AGAM|nr:hypothetical protein Clacol_005537 [Clathrus columnatus]